MRCPRGEGVAGIKALTATVLGSSWKLPDAFQSPFPYFVLLVPQVSTQHGLQHFPFQDPEEPPPPPSASLSSQPQAKVMAL